MNSGYVHVSRSVSSTWLHPDIVENPTEFETELLDFLARSPDIKLIYPVGENSLRRLASIRSAIPPDVLVTMPANETIRVCLDKPSAYRMAKRCRVLVPDTRTVKTADELIAVARELSLPLIAKASDSTSLLLGKKCVFVRTASDLKKLVDNWPASNDEYVVQEEINGRRYNCDIVAQNGQIKLYLESEIQRTDQADYAGNSVFDRSIPPTPIHGQFCERLIAELDFTGLALVQFLRDEDAGTSYFLEVNPRAGSTIGLAVNCGMNMPAASVQAHAGKPVAVATSYPVTRSQSWLHGDLLGIFKSRLEGEVEIGQLMLWLARAFADFLRADFHTTFVWRDPKPTMVLYRNLFLRLFIKSKRRSARLSSDNRPVF